MRVDDVTRRYSDGRVVVSPHCSLAPLLEDDSFGDFVEVEHQEYARRGLNIMQLARRDEALRPVVEAAVRSGFVVYGGDDSVSRFVRISRIPSFWHIVDGQTVRTSDEGLIYSLRGGDPEVDIRGQGHGFMSLLVVLSSMSSPWDKASLSRYFEPNYRSIHKFVPRSAAVLRVADIDGVVGGFYLDTLNAPHRTDDVVRLIRRSAELLGVPRDRVLVYGASKGATGAVAVGLGGGWSFVAVDPVVEDEYYEARYGDSHWTRNGPFLARKREVFANLAAPSAKTQFRPPLRVVVTSANSPLYPSIDAWCGAAQENLALSVFEATDPEITEHAHVSIRTLRTVTGLINMGVQGIPVPAGRFSIFT